MPQGQARRGRPRGSGLDDRAQLTAVIQKLKADPALKPTTAIKSIGIQDPSTIRRLRDKLRIVQAGEPENGSEENGTRATAPQGSKDGARVSARHAAAPQAGQPGGALVPAVQLSPEQAVAWFAIWCGIGLYALSTTFEVQMTAIEKILWAPRAPSGARHEEASSDHVLAFCGSSPDVRKTLH
jgi:hypothetical protein